MFVHIPEKGEDSSNKFHGCGGSQNKEAERIQERAQERVKAQESHRKNYGPGPENILFRILRLLVCRQKFVVRFGTGQSIGVGPTTLGLVGCRTEVREGSFWLRSAGLRRQDHKSKVSPTINVHMLS